MLIHEEGEWQRRCQRSATEQMVGTMGGVDITQMDRISREKGAIDAFYPSRIPRLVVRRLK